VHPFLYSCWAGMKTGKFKPTHALWPLISHQLTKSLGTTISRPQLLSFLLLLN
jgi:hypothetical protein